MTVVIGDIHGYPAAIDMIVQAYPERDFLFLGDLIDRGPDTPGVIERVRALHSAGRALVLRGNHEDMLIRGVRYGNQDLLRCWFANGGQDALSQYQKLPDGRFREDVDWLDDHLLHWHELSSPEGPLLCAHASRPAAHILAHGANRTDPQLSFRYDYHLWNAQQKYRPKLAPHYAASVHGHVPQRAARRENGAYYLDLGGYDTGRFAVLDTHNMALREFRLPR